MRLSREEHEADSCFHHYGGPSSTVTTRDMIRPIFCFWSAVAPSARFHSGRISWIKKSCSDPLQLHELSEILAKPSWSVKSLLDTADEGKTIETITQKQLHHLLRLSALPIPKSPEEEQEMTSTLQSQLHFVRAIQNTDTNGVQPLQSIRDETKASIKESTISVESLKVEMDKEEIVGYSRRIRRRKDIPAPIQEGSNWDPLALASKKIGRYIVVETNKG